MLDFAGVTFILQNVVPCCSCIHDFYSWCRIVSHVPACSRFRDWKLTYSGTVLFACAKGNEVISSIVCPWQTVVEPAFAQVHSGMSMCFFGEWLCGRGFTLIRGCQT